MTIWENCGKIHYQLSKKQLIDEAIKRHEGVLASNGALNVKTGERTGRSPHDRFIVRDDITDKTVHWGEVNQPIDPSVFEHLYQRAEKFIESREMFVSDCQVGADELYAIPVRVMTEFAWHNLFCQNLFIPKKDSQIHALPKNAWTLISLPTLSTDPKKDNVHSEATLIINFSKRCILLCGLRYAGEMKKAMFTIMNFLMPDQDVLPMHCAAAATKDDETILFFGLSGTGKTTLSADPRLKLIGDDEHGWHQKGVFNFEGGCYAKCINLREKNEPLIYHAINHEAVMENVVLDKSGNPDYDDASLTQNTRVGYSRDHIEGCVPSNTGGIPKSVVFLTCDLYGVIPPVAKLTKEQAAYHFLSGYTAMVGSTEVGQGSGIKPTFSVCFGAPFFPRPPMIYAELLMKRIEDSGAQVYLVNTGWTGGAYQEGGKRFSIPTTRAIVHAVMTHEGDYSAILPGFQFHIPKTLKNVDEKCLDPRLAWTSKDAYDKKLNELIHAFQENFKKFHVSEAIASAAPVTI